MTPGVSTLLCLLIFAAALLYLNVLVATIATVQFYRAGHFLFSLFSPFAVASRSAS